VISIIMNKFARNKDRNYTLLGILPLKISCSFAA
jgi:hypothetical protein